MDLLKQTLIFVKEAPSALAMFDRDMRYMAYSDQWVEDYQLEGIELLGQSHYEIFPEISDEWKQIHRECLAGATNKCHESSFERADGTTQWISWDVRPWHLPDGKIGGIIMNTSDITPLKKSVQERLQLEELLHRTNQIARIGSWEVDLVQNTIYWSPVTCEIHEMPHDYQPDLDTAIKFYKEGTSRTRIERAVQAGIERGESWDLEVELITAKGKTIWTRAKGQPVFENGSCVRLFGVFQDINEKKLAELAMQRTEAELRTILNSGYVSIIGTTVDGVITHFSKGAERLLGYSADELVHKETPARIHVESEAIQRGKELTAELGRNIEGFEAFVAKSRIDGFESREWTYVRKDGSTFPVQLVVSTLRNSSSEIIGFLGVATDISDLKAMEKEKDNLLELTVDQNSRLKNFAHIVSHNLRSHSGNLSMLLDMIETTYPRVAKEPLYGHLTDASSALKETIAHLNQVVNINSTTSHAFEKVDLKSALEVAIGNIQNLAQTREVSIENRVNEPLEILGIPAYVDSILLNFLSNAIKYSSPKRKSYVSIAHTISGQFTALSIEDNGIGINLELNGPKLFGMYKTFHEHEEARGIGLFITKNQMDALQGKIEVESTVDKGTTFKLLFRKYEDPN